MNHFPSNGPGMFHPANDIRVPPIYPLSGMNFGPPQIRNQLMVHPPNSNFRPPIYPHSNNMKTPINWQSDYNFTPTNGLTFGVPANDMIMLPPFHHIRGLMYPQLNSNMMPSNNIGTYFNNTSLQINDFGKQSLNFYDANTYHQKRTENFNHMSPAIAQVPKMTSSNTQPHELQSNLNTTITAEPPVKRRCISLETFMKEYMGKTIPGGTNIKTKSAQKQTNKTEKQERPTDNRLVVNENNNNFVSQTDYQFPRDIASLDKKQDTAAIFEHQYTGALSGTQHNEVALSAIHKNPEFSNIQGNQTLPLSSESNTKIFPKTISTVKQRNSRIMSNTSEGDSGRFTLETRDDPRDLCLENHLLRNSIQFGPQIRLQKYTFIVDDALKQDFTLEAWDTSNPIVRMSRSKYNWIFQDHPKMCRKFKRDDHNLPGSSSEDQNKNGSVSTQRQKNRIARTIADIEEFIIEETTSHKMHLIHRYRAFNNVLRGAMTTEDPTFNNALENSKQ